jgi:hypothetical protein
MTTHNQKSKLTINNTPYIMDVPGRSLDAAPPGSSPYGLQQKHTFFNYDTKINTHHLGTPSALKRPCHLLDSLRCPRESSTPSLCSAQTCKTRPKCCMQSVPSLTHRWRQMHLAVHCHSARCHCCSHQMKHLCTCHVHIHYQGLKYCGNA